MNIVTDTAFAFTALPPAQLPKSSTEHQLPLAGPGLAGGGPQPSSAPPTNGAANMATVDARPLIDRAMELAKEVIQSVVNQLFELLQSGVTQLVESLLASRSSAASQGSPSDATVSSADPASTSATPVAERVASWIDSAATAANVFILGRGALGIAGRVKRGVASGAKAAASIFEKVTVAPDLLRTLGSRIRSALT